MKYKTPLALAGIAVATGLITTCSASRYSTAPIQALPIQTPFHTIDKRYNPDGTLKFFAMSVGEEPEAIAFVDLRGTGINQDNNSLKLYVQSGFQNWATEDPRIKVFISREAQERYSANPSYRASLDRLISPNIERIIEGIEVTVRDRIEVISLEGEPIILDGVGYERAYSTDTLEKRGLEKVLPGAQTGYDLVKLFMTPDAKEKYDNEEDFRGKVLKVVTNGLEGNEIEGTTTVEYKGEREETIKKRDIAARNYNLLIFAFPQDKDN